MRKDKCLKNSGIAAVESADIKNCKEHVNKTRTA